MLISDKSKELVIGYSAEVIWVIIGLASGSRTVGFAPPGLLISSLSVMIMDFSAWWKIEWVKERKTSVEVPVVATLVAFMVDWATMSVLFRLAFVEPMRTIFVVFLILQSVRVVVVGMLVIKNRSSWHLSKPGLSDTEMRILLSVLLLCTGMVALMGGLAIGEFRELNVDVRLESLAMNVE